METIKSLVLQTSTTSSSDALTGRTEYEKSVHRSTDDRIVGALLSATMTRQEDIHNQEVTPLQQEHHRKPNYEDDFIHPKLSKLKQPPVIVGVAVKRSLRKPAQSMLVGPETKGLPEPPSTGDTLAQWHKDIFETPSLQQYGDLITTGPRNEDDKSFDDLITLEETQETKGEDEIGDNDLIDFSSDLEEPSNAPRELAPKKQTGKQKKVTFLLEPSEDETESSEGDVNEEDGEEEEEEDTTYGGDIDTLDEGGPTAWRVHRNEIPTETRQTDDIVRRDHDAAAGGGGGGAGHVDSDEAGSGRWSPQRLVVLDEGDDTEEQVTAVEGNTGTETVQCAGSSPLHGVSRRVQKSESQHSDGVVGDGAESAGMMVASEVGRKIDETFTTTTATVDACAGIESSNNEGDYHHNHYYQQEQHPDQHDHRGGERSVKGPPPGQLPWTSIDDKLLDGGDIEKGLAVVGAGAGEQQQQQQRQRRWRRRIDEQRLPEGSTDDDDDNAATDEQPSSSRLGDDGSRLRGLECASASSSSTLVDHLLTERTVQEVQQEEQAKVKENVLTEANEDEDKKSQLVTAVFSEEKGTQVPSPFHQRVKPPHQQHHQQQVPALSSDSESENYYGTCSPPPTVVHQASDCCRCLGPQNHQQHHQQHHEQQQQQGDGGSSLLVEVTLSAHICVHQHPGGGRCGHPRTPSPDVRVLRDSATNTQATPYERDEDEAAISGDSDTGSASGSERRRTKDPSSADSGIILLDDELGEDEPEQRELREHYAVVEEGFDHSNRSSAEQCDRDTQTFIGNYFIDSEKPSLRTPTSVFGCVGEREHIPRSAHSATSSTEPSCREEQQQQQQQQDPEAVGDRGERRRSSVECFEASQRLKRLEERFRGFAQAKKLLRESRRSGGAATGGSLPSLLVCAGHPPDDDGGARTTDYANTNTRATEAVLCDGDVGVTTLTQRSTRRLLSSVVAPPLRARTSSSAASSSERKFAASRKTSSLSCLQQEATREEDDTEYYLLNSKQDHQQQVRNPKLPPGTNRRTSWTRPILPPLSSSLLSLSASSLLSLSCLDLERQARKRREEQRRDQPTSGHGGQQLGHSAGGDASEESNGLSKAVSLPSLFSSYPEPAVVSGEAVRLEHSPGPASQQRYQRQPRVIEELRRNTDTPESSGAESEEICKIFPGGKALVEDPLEIVETVVLTGNGSTEEEDDEDEDEDDAEEDTSDSGVSGGGIEPAVPAVGSGDQQHEEQAEFVQLEKLLAADPHTNCEFDTRHLQDYEPDVYRIKYCYDELEEELEEQQELLVSVRGAGARTSVAAYPVGPPPPLPPPPPPPPGKSVSVRPVCPASASGRRQCPGPGPLASSGQCVGSIVRDPAKSVSPGSVSGLWRRPSASGVRTCATATSPPPPPPVPSPPPLPPPPPPPPPKVPLRKLTAAVVGVGSGCGCVIEAVPLYRSEAEAIAGAATMRETTGGTLRGLLKKPNRPPPVRKNRVVFDETRNEFFEADYIILIREDCPYDEEDEEPCTCGEHELVRICCDEGCNCGYTDDGRTPPSPKFAPPIEFVDQATLSPPEGYKDGSGLLDNALGGALGGHVFGAQHIQQLQVIQRLQQQRAAMLAARAAAGQQGQQTGTAGQPGQPGSQPSSTAQAQSQQQQQQQQQQPQQAQSAVCTECAECAECAAKQMHDEECDSQCSDDISPMLEAPLPPHAALPIALVPLAKASPERRVTAKEIIAGEERPKFLTIKQVQDSSAQDGDGKGEDGGDGSTATMMATVPNPQRYIVETITMTTVTERRILQKGSTATDPVVLPAVTGVTSTSTSSSSSSTTIPTIVPAGNEGGSTAVPVAGTGAGSTVPMSSTVAQDYRLLQQQQQQQQKQLRAGQVSAGADTNTTAQQQQQQQQQLSASAGTGHYDLGKQKPLSTAQAISGILKGGKLWKNEQQHQQQHQQHQQQQQQQQQQPHQQQSSSSAQNEDSTTVTSDEETSSKRSVRFNEESTIREACCDGEVQSGLGEGEIGTCRAINYMSDTLKRHSSGLFHNALRPNSAVRQLFPSSAIQPLLTTAGPAGTGVTPSAGTVTMATSNTPSATTTTMVTTGGAVTVASNTGSALHPQTLTQEALKAFDDSKKTGLASGLVHQHSLTSNSGSMSNIPGSAAAALAVSAAAVTGGPGETDTIRRTIERNALRRSLIKYEPKKKIPVKDVTSLEERIRQLTCDIDDPIDEGAGSDQAGEGGDLNEMERRDSPAGEENPQQPKYIPDKSFSPSSSASSSSSGSNGSTYKKITDLFHRDRRQEKIPEADENPIVIIPQDCRCPAGPDIGMGVQIQGGHTQIHQPPQQRGIDSRRQFLSTLAPLTACVAGQRDDLSYYTLAHPGDRTSMASSQSTEYSIGDIDAALHDDDGKKVAPDVIAGTPGQESDELAAFVQQEGARTERLKKRYSAETSTSAPASGAGSDDDEQNDYGFNSRPSVRGIKPRFGSTNEILQQMQAQLAAPSNPAQAGKTQTTAGATSQSQPIQSNTLPRPHTASSMHVAAAKQQITTHQHTASWSYYPAVDPAQAQGGKAVVLQPSTGAQQSTAAAAAAAAAAGTASATAQPNLLAAVDPHGNYYHIPVQTRHSYHGQEAIYQNCANLPLGVQASAVQVQSHQIHTQHQAVHTAHHIHQMTDTAAYGKFARSPTRRPESPPPLRNYHQTMVLIPYNAETYHRYTAQEQENYRRQHNIVEYQQVTQQTIRVPVGYPLPGMQLHVVAAGARTAGLPPHYSTLPRLGTNTAPVNAATTTTTTGSQSTATGGTMPPAPQGKPPAYSQYPPTQDGKPAGVVKFTERGAPEGAASVQPADANQLLSPTGQGHGPPGMPCSVAQSSATTTAGTTSGQGPTAVSAGSVMASNAANTSTGQGGAVFYAMNV